MGLRAKIYFVKMHTHPQPGGQLRGILQTLVIGRHSAANPPSALPGTMAFTVAAKEPCTEISPYGVPASKRAGGSSQSDSPGRVRTRRTHPWEDR